MFLADGSLYEINGKIDFIDREVDPTTGAILVQASFANPDKIIRPEQFAKVRILAASPEDGILILQRSVMELQGNHNVYVVDESNSVKIIHIGATEKSANRRINSVQRDTSFECLIPVNIHIPLRNIGPDGSKYSDIVRLAIPSAPKVRQ